MKRNIIKGIKQASKPVSAKERRKLIGNDANKVEKQRNKPIQGAKKTEELPEELPEDTQATMQSDQKFTQMEVTSSTGKRYKIVVPESYAKSVPREWHWTIERYRVAELIAMGIPFSQIPDDPKVTIKSRMTIYCWLQHPEFKEHVDGLTLETGWANKRERISGLNRLTRIMFDKVVSEIESMPLTDKSVGAVLTAIRDVSKLIAQEKEEFVEESKVTQDTHISGALATVETKLEDILNSKTEDERRELEKEFDEMGDDIIRTLTGKS